MDRQTGKGLKHLTNSKLKFECYPEYEENQLKRRISKIISSKEMIVK